MRFYRVPADAVPHGGDIVPEGYDAVTFKGLAGPVVVTAESGARMGSAGGPVVATWDGEVTRFDGTIRGDRMYGADAGSTLVGGRGHDKLWDGGHDAEASRLYGGLGSDTMYLAAQNGSRANGGSGNDKFVVSDDSHGHVIKGGDGFDSFIWRDADGDAERLRVDLRIGQAFTEDDGRVARIYGVERVVGAGGNDILIGDGLANRLDGSDGNDRLFGFQGDDQLFGGAGNDVLNASKGHDILNGGAGNDRLLGGADGDTFVWDAARAGEKDTISIFGHEDVLDMRGVADRLADIEITWGAERKSVTLEVDGHQFVVEKLLDWHGFTDQLLLG